MHKGHPLAGKQSISSEDLRGVPLIQSVHTLPKSDLTEWYKGVADDIDVVATYNLLYNAALMAESGIGCVLCLDQIVNTTGDSELCFRPLFPEVTAQLNVVWKKYQIFSQAAQLFLNFLRDKLKAGNGTL